MTSVFDVLNVKDNLRHGMFLLGNGKRSWVGSAHGALRKCSARSQHTNYASYVPLKEDATRYTQPDEQQEPEVQRKDTSRASGFPFP